MNYWGEITFNDLGWFGRSGGMDILKPGKASPSLVDPEQPHSPIRHSITGPPPEDSDEDGTRRDPPRSPDSHAATHAAAAESGADAIGSGLSRSRSPRRHTGHELLPEAPRTHAAPKTPLIEPDTKWLDAPEAYTPLLEVCLCDEHPPAIGSWQFWQESLCFLFGFLHPDGRQSKLWQEPYPGNTQERICLERLRFLARRLGGGWQNGFLPEEPFILEDDQSDRSENDSEEPDPGVRTLHFVILCPGFRPECIAIELALPATVEEALAAVQVGRQQQHRRCFPRLIAVCPQPCPGIGVLIALAVADRSHCVLCIETLAIDGRVFATPSPAYINGTSCVELANLPTNLEVMVAVKGCVVDSQDACSHVSSGDTVSVFPADMQPGSMSDLGVNLLNHQAWTLQSTLPILSPSNAYCLVSGWENILFLNNFGSPFDYRNGIAACVGIKACNIRLSPAKPVVGDAAIDGLPCKTVIAVGDRSQTDPEEHEALFDARVVGLGWFALTTRHSQIAFDRVVQACQDGIPEGWRIHIPSLPAEPAFFDTTAGQVFQIELARHSPAIALAREPMSTGDHEGPPPAAQPTSDPPVPQGNSPPSAGDEGFDLDADVDQRTTQSPQSLFANGVFVIYGQNYIPEVVHARLPLGTRVTDALHFVAVARQPQHNWQLPRLCSVYPQLAGSHAVLVALPAWNPDGAVVLFDCSQIDGRIFSLQIGNRIDRQGILNATDLANSADVHVYVSDQPWPLVDGVFVNISHGDLIVVMPYRHRTSIVSNLGDMLMSRAGWGANFVNPPAAQEVAWVLADDRSFGFHVQAARRISLRIDLAAILAVPAAELIVRPATPDVVDFAYVGRGVRNVLAAVRTSGGTHHGAPRPSLCFIDQRPILLQLYWTWCSGGWMHLEPLFSRHATRCPAGFRVGIWQGNNFVTDHSTHVHVQDGETLTVVFYPAATTPPTPPHDGENPDYDPGLDDGEADDTPSHPATGGNGGDTARLHDAGTGGSATAGPARGNSAHAYAPDSQSAAHSVPSAHADPARQPGTCVSRPASHFSLAAGCGKFLFLLTLGSLPRLAPGVGITGDADPLCTGGMPSAQKLIETPARPIPTPCRAPLAVHDAAPPAHPNVSEPQGSSEGPTSRSWRPCEPPCFLQPPSSPFEEETSSLLQTWKAGLQLPEAPVQAQAVLGADLDKPLLYGPTPLGFTPRQLHALFRPHFHTSSVAQCLSSLPSPIAQALAAVTAVSDRAIPEGVTCYTDGSFVPATTQQPSRCGWACAFVDKANRTLDLIAGTIPSWCNGEDAKHSAFRAECWAMIVGLWIGTATQKGCSFRIVSDCQAALAIAKGEAAVHAGGVATLLGHIAGCCRDAVADGPLFEYIPGHKGFTGNEIADILAKAAAAGQPTGMLQWTGNVEPFWWCNHGSLWSWAGTVCRWARGDDALPSPLGEELQDGRHAGGMSVEDMSKPFIPAGGCTSGVLSHGQLSLRTASYNALSLASGRRTASDEGLAFQPAKPALLAGQLERSGVHFAAVQEARTDEGTLHSGSFFRFCSGSSRGHFGVELWFRRNHKLITFHEHSKPAVVFDPANFVVLFKDPRRIGVLFKQGDCQIVFVSLHAPHRGSPHDELQDWWQQTELILFQASRGKLLVVGADCNAAVGSVTSAHVGQEAAEEQDFPGDMLHTLCHKCELWLPATFSYVQHGPSWTFAQRRNGALTRADYVLFPISWSSGKIQTWTDASVTAGNMVLDHVAAVADVQIQIACKSRSSCRSQANIDTAAISNPANRAQLESILRAAPRPSWDVNAHAHVATVTRYLQESLSEAFPRGARKPLHPYLSPEAWELQQQVAWLRRKLARVKSMSRQQVLLAVFAAWKAMESVQASASGWLREVQVAEALYGFRLGLLSKALRLRCKRDRAVYLENLADDIEANNSAATEAVQRLMARRRRKPFAPDVLPAVKDAQGIVCASPEDAITRWREHFSALEDGHVASPAQLLEHASAGQGGSWPAPVSLDVMPSPQDVRNAILSAKRGKASGPDALPGEIGLACSDALQAILFPLALKLGFLGEEAVGFKGGSLTWLWKGKAARDECASYRGILLLSTLGKALHRAFRPRIQRHYELNASALQLGGRRGVSVNFASHAMRTFMAREGRQIDRCALCGCVVGILLHCP